MFTNKIYAGNWLFLSFFLLLNESYVDSAEDDDRQWNRHSVAASIVLLNVCALFVIAFIIIDN